LGTQRKKPRNAEIEIEGVSGSDESKLPRPSFLQNSHQKPRQNSRMFDEKGDKSRLHALFAKENRTSIPI